MTDDQREVRLRKLEAMRAEGIRPYADRYPVSHTLAEARELAERQEDPDPESGRDVTVAGRILTARSFGKLTFLTLQDRSGRCQVSLNRKDIDPDSLSRFRRFVDLGDFIGVAGRTGRTNKGEPTVFARGWTFLSKALRPLPDKWHGVHDEEIRQRERYLELITSPEARERFRLRTRLVRELRRFLDDHGFEEVDTPVLQTKKSGALARPFYTHHNALDMTCVLRIAPETWLKQCVAGGIERVYEIARCFRNEGMDPSHLQDFSMLEWYAAYWDYHDNMDFTERLILHVLDRLVGSRVIRHGGREISFEPPWPRLSFRDLILRDAGFDFEEFRTRESLLREIRSRGIELERSADELERAGRGTLIDLLYKKVSRPNLIDPTFVTGHPIDLSPLARRNDDDASVTDRYQLVVNTWEIVNAYSELVDPIDQRERFEQQARAGAEGDDEALEVDEDYLKCMEHGMPPMSGFGMGIERFLALLTDQDNLRDVVLFPLMRPLSDPRRKTTGAPGVPKSDPPGSPAGDLDRLGIGSDRVAELAREMRGAAPEGLSAMAGEIMAAVAAETGADPAVWRDLGRLLALEGDPAEVAAALEREGAHPAAIHAVTAAIGDDLEACRSPLDCAAAAARAAALLIHAAAQVLPSRDVRDLKQKSLRKKFRDARFASAIPRERIDRIERAGLEREPFLELALRACQREPS